MLRISVATVLPAVPDGDSSAETIADSGNSNPAWVGGVGDGCKKVSLVPCAVDFAKRLCLPTMQRR